MELRTSHTSEEALAKACHRRLKAAGLDFPAVFPFNRYDHHHTTWWLSFKGSPAYAAAKLYFHRRSADPTAIECGVVLEKGYEGEATRKAHLRLADHWDWERFSPLMREASFSHLLQSLSPLGLSVRISAHPGGAGRPSGECLRFELNPWTQVEHDVDTPASRPLKAVVGATSMRDFVDRLQSNPGRAFWWYDLYIGARVRIDLREDDWPEWDDDLVDRLILPMARWFWPQAVP